MSAELIDQVRFTPSAEYTFHHPLIHAVAYESLLKSDRAELHRRVASAIESRGAATAEEDAALIAGASGARQKGAVSEKLIGGIEELDGTAAVGEGTVVTGDAALNDLRGGSRSEDERVGTEGDAEADGTADEVIGRGAESGR